MALLRMLQNPKKELRHGIERIQLAFYPSLQQAFHVEEEKGLQLASPFVGSKV